jgi:hypothetical protein
MLPLSLGDIISHRIPFTPGKGNAIVNIKVIHWPSKTDPLALV